MSHEAGLPTWDKPAYACLATRIASGEQITAEKLRAVEQGEDYLFFTRLHGFPRPRARERRPAAIHSRADGAARTSAFTGDREEAGGVFDSVTIDPKVREKSV